MDPGYSPDNRHVIEENARKLGIPVHIFESDIFDAVYTIENPLVTFAPECAADTFTVMQRN